MKQLQIFILDKMESSLPYPGLCGRCPALPIFNLNHFIYMNGSETDSITLSFNVNPFDFLLNAGVINLGKEDLGNISDRRLLISCKKSAVCLMSFHVIRPVREQDCSQLLQLGINTGIFSPGEAEELLGSGRGTRWKASAWASGSFTGTRL